MKTGRIMGCLFTLAFLAITFCAGPSVAAEHEEVSVTLFSGRTATTNWAIFQGMADIVNKNHPWLRISVTSLSSAVESFRTAATREALRSKSFYYGDQPTQSAFSQGVAGLPKYDGLLAVLKVYSGWDSWVTLDPSIKTVYDFAGKKVDVGLKGSTVNLLQTVPIIEAAGVFDKVKPLNLGWSKGKDGLVNGNIDAYWTYAGESDPPKWAAQTLLVELMKTKKIYFVDIPKEVTSKLSQDLKINLPSIALPAGSIGEGQPPADVLGIMYDVCLWATKDLDAEVVYEFVKTVAEHVGELGNYHAAGKAASLEKLASFALPESQYHPGALRFYREEKLLK